MSCTPIPDRIASKSISGTELVLSLKDAFVALNWFEKNAVQITGWEGWTRTPDGRVGHGSAPQGTVDLSKYSPAEAADICRASLLDATEAWNATQRNSEYELFFCLGTEP